MSHLENVQSLVAADCERVREPIAGIETAKASAEETVSGFEAVGAEGKAAGATGMTDQLEEVQAIAQSAIPMLEAIHAQAEALKTGGQAGAGATVTVESDGSFTVSGEVPRSQWRNEVGDKVEDPGEVDGAADKVAMNKFRRAGRGLVRDSGRANSQAKDFGDVTGYLARDAYNPLQGSTASTSVETRPPQSFSNPSAQDVNVGDLLGTTVVMAAVFVEGVGRIKGRLAKRKQRGSDADGS